MKWIAQFMSRKSVGKEHNAREHAIQFAALNIVNQVLDVSGASVDRRQAINDKCDELAVRVINKLLHETEKDFREACELIVAVKHCMMFSQAHADWMVKEVLDKHGVASVQLLAKKAQDAAERALGEQPKEKTQS